MADEIIVNRAAAGSGVDPNTIARLASQRSRYRDQAKALEGENARLKADLDRLNGENADLKVKADGSVSAKRVAELEQQIREGNHRKAFEKVAKAKGVPDDTFDALYQLSGYRAEGDQPDEAAIDALLDQAKGKPGLSRLFGQPAGDGQEQGQGTPIVKPAAGSGQGRRDVGAPIVDDDPRYSDVKWAWENFDANAKAAQERIARGEI